MARIDELFGDLDEVWVWTPPHPGDGRGVPRRRVQTRIGTRHDASLDARLGISGKKDRIFSGMVIELLDLTGAEDRAIGGGDLKRSQIPGQPLEGRLHSEDQLAHISTDGYIRLPSGGLTYSEIFTRGSPPAVHPELDLKEMGTSALRLGRQLLGSDRAEALARRRRERAAIDAEFRANRAASREFRARIDRPLTAFDGWLVATQHLESGGADAVESWHVAIDHRREAPESLGLTLAACGVLLQLRWKDVMDGRSIDGIFEL